ncbi:MAG: methyltransferase [Candidatus Entotheonella gemina]|uniref:Methyltransferase n=1 Tax=Candidatus Entotheonella gemina TaxID=1429439 RepID=W4M5Q5_9BACT|nr:MAG: methyltransferase [Candidatus Entotheonella gemina]
MNIEDKVAWVHGSTSHQELAERYDIWAHDYDRDLIDEAGYIGPQRAVEELTQYLSKDAKILDAGVGTGLVGKILHEQGYDHLEGMDLSAGMLQKAAEKKVYTALHQQVMGEPLDFATDSFDGIVSVGVLTYGHAPSSSFDELIRITKPGGYIIFPLISEFYETSDFKAKMTALETSGQWQLVSLSDPFQALPKMAPDFYYQIWVYRVGSAR